MGKDKYFFKDINDIYEWRKKAIHNGQDIPPKLDDNGKKIYIKENDFVGIIKKQVQSFINQNFDNIILLIGAGGSICGNDYGKTMGQILKDVKDLLHSEVYLRCSGTKRTKKVHVYNLEKLKKVIGYKAVTNHQDDLEDIISQLIAYIQVNKYRARKPTKVINTRDAIFDLIKKETSYTYESTDLNHGKIIKILSDMLDSSKKLAVVTTNYDTMIEDAANENNFTIIDGFSFSQPPIFNDDEFEWQFTKKPTSIKTKEYVYKDNVIDLLKIHGSLTWWLDGGKVFRMSKEHLVDKNPLMIFPSSNKYMRTYDEPFFELFSRFQGLLRKPNTLLISTGFSFNDNHISRIITQAIKHNPGLRTLITNYDIDEESLSTGKNNMSSLNKLCGEQYPIAFLKGTLNGENSIVEYLGGDIDEQN